MLQRFVMTVSDRNMTRRSVSDRFITRGITCYGVRDTDGLQEIRYKISR